ncbi:unnamed protein product [Dibothriocephalus latus]|uniref:Structure-specific endonuclease subunit SLX1 homolog n=1 Tax=Dibothriocephalus latus TaxID=60516 RepID=A0A3P7NZI8_DIBLA|nr:unnamed protein product [Dibothriocephalus latus]
MSALEEEEAQACVKNGFYGCYLLVSVGSRCKGKTYIGFTVNPNRRILQHNAGPQHGGAKSTAGKGPWIMALIVHGFPSDISALQFEWAWQNPYQSRRLSAIPPRTKRESPFDFRFRILCHMLNSPPWRRLGLTVRWANQEYKREFSPELAPPIHMPVAYGPIETPKPSNSSFLPPPSKADLFCQLCLKPFDESSDLASLSLHCPLGCPQGVWHIVCLARHLTSEAAKRPLSSVPAVEEAPPKPQLLPLDGICPACEAAEFLWPELLASQQPGVFK